MKSRWCFCFKRNRASYNISSEQISYRNSNAVISTKPHYENTNDSSDDRQIDTNREYLTSTTSTTSNGHTSMKPERLSQPPPSDEDFSALYATVDKTRKAKNSIRIAPDTFNMAGSRTSLQPMSSLNSYSSEHPPRPMSLYANIPVNTRTSHRHSYCNEVESRQSLSNRDQCFTIEEKQAKQNSLMKREPKISSGSDIYAEIAGSSTSGTIYANHQSNSSFPPFNDDNEKNDNISERYATIK